jgi:outer membrane protein TolC
MRKEYVALILAMSTLFAQAQVHYSLEDCRSMALKSNKGIKIDEQKLIQDKEKHKVAFTKYLPNFSLNAAYMYNSKNISLMGSDAYLPVGTIMPDGTFGFRPDQVKGTTINGVWMPVDKNGVPFNPTTNPEKIVWNNYAYLPKDAFTFDIQNVFVGALSVSQPIYTGGKITAYNQISKYKEELTKSQINTNRQEVIAKTDELYFQVLMLKNKQKLANAYIQLIEKMDSDVINLIASGVATRADELAVSVKLNEAEMTRTKVENGLHLSQMALCQLCGLDLETQLDLSDESNVTKEIWVTDADVHLGIVQRTELQSLEIAQLIYRKKESLVIADMLPQIALTGNYLMTNPNSFNGYENKFGGMWNVGVAMHIPIFHWGENFHNLKAARSETKVVELQYEEAKEKIELQINQCKFKMNEAQKRLLNTEKNLERAAENLKYATLGFQAGMITTAGLLDAQTAWLSANSDKIDAEIEVKLSHTQLQKAMGELK